MAEKFTIKAELREGRGKEDAKRLRREGKIPVVVYGGGKDAVAATATVAELAAILRTDAGANTLFSLDIAGDVSDVIFQDRQVHPVKGRLIHADLRRIAKGEKVEMTLPIHLVGEAAGLNEEGAVLNQPIHEIKALVDPAKAPDSIEVDVTALNMGEAIHVSDLKAPAGVEFHEDPETVVVAVMFQAQPSLESAVEEGAQPEVTGEEKPEGE